MDSGANYKLPVRSAIGKFRYECRRSHCRNQGSAGQRVRLRDCVLSYLVADTELREDLQDSITIEARRDEASRPLAEVLNDLGLKT
jgi:hypothetical protein